MSPAMSKGEQSKQLLDDWEENEETAEEEDEEDEEDEEEEEKRLKLLQDIERTILKDPNMLYRYL